MTTHSKYGQRNASIMINLAIKSGMGLIGRAFGADKNSMLFNSLAMHWRMVSSHYENYVAKNELSPAQAQVMRDIQATSTGIANRVIDSKKGFGITSPDVATMNRDLESILNLYSQIESKTEKHNWLPEAVFATKDILAGSKRNYQNRQYWFSE